MSEISAVESFINYKANTHMQCGNYNIDIPPLKEGEQYRFHFDATACVGCRCCEVACNEQNNNSADVKWRRVGEMEVGEYPNMMLLFNSMSCNHCVDPACLNGCPTSSYIKLENGIVFHEDNTCIGCQYCTWNCPYEVPVFNKDRGIVTKCHMCIDKLENGEAPACVQACPAGAIEIEVVNKDEWIKNDLKKEGVAPHLPDVEITKPTTRYTLPKDVDLSKVKPADSHIIKPAHPEFPLVFMTVLTQASVGGFVALFLGALIKLLGFSKLAGVNSFVVFFVVLLALIGLPLSALHLGRPKLAYTAIKNWKNSWLAKEALLLGIYALSGIGLWIGYLIDSSFLKFIFYLIGLGSGILGIYSQAMIYRIGARPSWDRDSTNKRFFATFYLGFMLVATILSMQGALNSAMVVLAFTLLIAAFQVLVIFEEKSFYKYLNEDEKNYYQLSRTKHLLENNFATHLKVRFYSLIIFGVAMPLFSTLFLANGNSVIASFLLIVSFFGALFSELLGRYLFYVSVVPLGLAGGFFVGNQRGRDYTN